MMDYYFPLFLYYQYQFSSALALNYSLVIRKQLFSFSPSPPAVPAAPQNVISIVNETSLRLEWSPPQESGGRDDVVFNIICKSCGSGRSGCTRCGDNVQFVPRQLGLTDTRVHISDLLAHTQYTFEIQAVNGVSDQSPYSPHYTSVNITTNQAGQFQWVQFQQLVCLSVLLIWLLCLSSTISSVHHPPGQQKS